MTQRSSSLTTPSARKQPGRRPDPKRSIATARERGINTSTKAGAALIDPDKPLTEQQKLFVHYWARGESILSASLKAGYQDGGTYAYRLVHQPNILKMYQAEKDAYERDSGMNRKRVIDGLLEGIEMAKTMAEPSSMIAGWREIGKLCGYYEPVQVKHTVDVQGKILVDRMEKLSDAELFELIQKQAAAISGNPALIPQDPDHDTSDVADGSEAP